MRRWYQWIRTAAVAGMLLAACPCLAFAGSGGGPGEVMQENGTGGVIRRDSGAQDAAAGENGQEVAAEAQTETAEKPGVPVDSIEGLTYDIRKIEAAKSGDVGQIIVVAGHDGSYARVTMYEKVYEGSGPEEYEWRVLVDTEGRMGRNGMGKEREGDEKTPVGLYTAGMVFGNKENPGTALPYTDVTPTMYWVGDSSSPYYNRLADTAVAGDVFDTGASEHLSAYGAVYNYCIDMGYNPEGTPYRGSALFLHCTNGYGTAGCVGIPEEDMADIVRFLKPGAKFLLDEADRISGY